MNILNTQKMKKQKAILTSVTFLMLSTSNLRALDILDENEQKTRRSSTTHQISKINLADQDKAFSKGKYNLVGISLFSGRDLVSKLIKGCTKNEASHVGLILADVNDENKWYSFEATGSAEKVLQGEWPHVHVKSWNKIVSEYDGNVKYRMLVFEDQARTNPKFVTNFVDVYDQKSYTKNPLRLLKALFRVNPKPRSNPLKTVFCSELTAKMLMDLGIMKGNIPGNFIPADFTDDKNIALTSGISLTPAYIEDKDDLLRRYPLNK